MDLGISYPAAKQAFEQRKGKTTYSSVVKSDQDKKFEDLAMKVEKLQHDMLNKDGKIEALIQQVEARDLEIKKRDARIGQLETALRAGPQERLSIAQEYGTIANLLPKLKTLEQKLEQKNKEVITLRKIYTPVGHSSQFEDQHHSPDRRKEKLQQDHRTYQARKDDQL